jgi:hypothetical protein
LRTSFTKDGIKNPPPHPWGRPSAASRKVSLIEAYRSPLLMKRVFIYSICIVIAAVAANAIFIALLIISKVSFISRLPQLINWVILIVGFGLAILLGIITFRNLLKYLKKELKDV